MMKIIPAALLVSGLLCGKALCADSVNIGVTGNIVASPCLFNNGNTNLDINLGNIQASNMVMPGSSSDPVTFDLLFTQCPVGTRSVTATFTGTPDPVAGADYYINRGTSTHVAIAMREAGSGILKGNGSSMTEYIASDRTAKMAMQAAVISTGGRATPGTLSAVVVITLQYN